MEESANYFDVAQYGNIWLSRSLKKQLRKRNISYRKLAIEMGLSACTINDKMNGKRSWSYPELLILADILSLDCRGILDVFFGIGGGCRY